MSFLIVDDNSLMRRAIGRVVVDLTDRVIERADGAEAVAAYRANSPEWILMDIEMNRTDGLTATKEICQAFPNARVVIVTNYGGADMREAAERAGAVAYVMKENLLELPGILQPKAS